VPVAALAMDEIFPAGFDLLSKVTGIGRLTIVLKYWDYYKTPRPLRAEPSPSIL
jgi:hypothetical protein